MADSNIFEGLYEYQTKNGVVLPITNDVKARVEEVFKGFFGEDFSVDPTTPQGRMIEAITLLFCDALRVCAVNANGFNPYQAVGKYLDNLGAMYGIQRKEGQSDSSYRKDIINSSSNGSGYAAAIRSALSRVDGVTSVSVLDNGNADPMMLPVGERQQVSVDAHSVLICVGGGSTEEIAKAIFDNISAGCGMQGSDIEDDPYLITEEYTYSGVTKNIVFHRPVDVSITINAKVRDTMYTGVNIIEDTKTAIESFIRGDITNRYFSEEDIVSAIASTGTGIICSELTITVNGNVSSDVKITPLQAISLADNAVTVELV